MDYFNQQRHPSLLCKQKCLLLTQRLCRSPPSSFFNDALLILWYKDKCKNLASLCSSARGRSPEWFPLTTQWLSLLSRKTIVGFFCVRTKYLLNSFPNQASVIFRLTALPVLPNAIKNLSVMQSWQNGNDILGFYCKLKITSTLSSLRDPLSRKERDKVEAHMRKKPRHKNLLSQPILWDLSQRK